MGSFTVTKDKQPSREELEEMIQFIAHEYALFDAIYERYQTLLDNDKDNAAYGEAFILHFRLLYDFFTKPRDERATKKDVLACDYYEDWSHDLSKLELHYSKAHAQLAHISTHRLPQYQPYNWDKWQRVFPTIYNQITEAWTEFLSAVPMYNEELKREHQKRKTELLPENPA